MVCATPLYHDNHIFRHCFSSDQRRITLVDSNHIQKIHRTPSGQHALTNLIEQNTNNKF